jgi:uncharacterized protein YdeI (YjbR/CyaY-like superfamily)
MPEDVRQALQSAGLEGAYEVRPAYQRNDYIGWIARAKREATRQQRIKQLLDELRCGGVYMKTRWHGRSEGSD